MSPFNDDTDRLYVLTRRDLPWSTRCVQAAHAATALTHVQHERFDGLWGTHGPAFVFYSVPDEPELRVWRDRLGKDAVPFEEPDLGDQLTALAYCGPKRPEFETLRLL